MNDDESPEGNVEVALLAAPQLAPDVLQVHGREVSGDLHRAFLVAEDAEEGAFDLAVTVEDAGVWIEAGLL